MGHTTTLINKVLVSEKGKAVRIRITFDGAAFETHIDIQNEVVCINRSFAPQLCRDSDSFFSIEPGSEEMLSDIRESLVKANQLIDKFTKTNGA